MGKRKVISDVFPSSEQWSKTSAMYKKIPEMQREDLVAYAQWITYQNEQAFWLFERTGALADGWQRFFEMAALAGQTVTQSIPDIAAYGASQGTRATYQREHVNLEKARAQDANLALGRPRGAAAQKKAAERARESWSAINDDLLRSRPELNLAERASYICRVSAERNIVQPNGKPYSAATIRNFLTGSHRN